MSETFEAPQLSGKMYLFDRPELLSAEAHGKLGLEQSTLRYNFCSKVRVIPLTVGEIISAARDYPIILFSQEDPVPLAVVGIVDDVNLFVGEDGNWEPYRYVPGYIRRYPFALANEAQGERVAVIIDAACEGLAADSGVPLFEGKEPTQATQAVIDFCKTYEEDRIRTQDFGKRLLELNCVESMTGQYTAKEGEAPKNFAQYTSINDEKFKAVPAEKLAELRDNGMLPIIYAMTTSLSNWRVLLDRRARRFNLTEEQILEQQIVS